MLRPYGLGAETAAGAAAARRLRPRDAVTAPSARPITAPMQAPITCPLMSRPVVYRMTSGMLTIA
jgi:hypothetical protein